MILHLYRAFFNWNSIEELDKVRQELESINKEAAEYLNLKKAHETMQSQMNVIQKDNKELTEEYTN